MENPPERNYIGRQAEIIHLAIRLIIYEYNPALDILNLEH